MIHKLYSMKLDEVIVTEDGNLFTTTMRVPGGWVYRSYDKSRGILGSCYVPYSNEFVSANYPVIPDSSNKD